MLEIDDVRMTEDDTVMSEEVVGSKVIVTRPSQHASNDSSLEDAIIPFNQGQVGHLKH